MNNCSSSRSDASLGAATVRVCVIIPAYNEELAIGDTLREYKNAFPSATLVVVDNRSTDSTASLAMALLDTSTDMLLSEHRPGKGHAVKRALGRVDADIYVMTDGDGTYPAADAASLVCEMINKRLDMIVGDRITGGEYDRQNTRRGHGYGNRLLTKVISRLSGQKYADVLSGLRIMSRPFVQCLDVRSSGFQLETELNIVAAYVRADVLEIPIRYRERGGGSVSKLRTFRDGISILCFALAHWIAFAPLQVFSLVAGVSVAAATLLSIRVIRGFILNAWPSTTTSVFAATLGLCGLLALFTGLSLRILGRDNRRRDIAALLESKRKWNKRLDSASL